MAILHEKPDNPVLALDHTNRGELLYRDERFEDALEESKLALGILADNVDARVIIDAHVLQVQSLLKLRRFDEVIRSCDAALAMGKKSAVLYELRGLAHAARNDYLGAIRDFGRALEIRPDDARLLAAARLGVPGLRLSQTGAGRLRGGHQARPGRRDAYNGRGTAQALLGDHAAAVADAREAVRPLRHDPRVTYNAARIYAVAASVAGTAVGEKGRQARQLAAKYEDIAVQLIRRVRTRSPRETRGVLARDGPADPALKAIRRRLRFEDLIVTNK